ncbi:MULTISPECIES: DUF488 domain-containing protein [Pseudomonas]|jgi:uncharacterized protein YeaO (DUF488 family)|uniref:DUF488 domain-containing protein n=1 Tax=Pseudomonas TaxID=286 RepID=UPI000D0172D5|nr:MULTISPECIES: DUF488 family protein [Pseudomonas]MBI6922665.1 DUF488 family protein [Pseudomonas monteilii]MCE0935684.1 DUF488 family protein [Pseudomonas kurunegalensis]MDR2318863.1 DUF488 family protein [Pseudomonas sp.]PRN04593.1 MarR family transcriptional regulator [Pseudomonas sp. LLC-1]PYG81078.1 uncharacterized protein YeaO (DUF488 family) [Pseudomonas sp. RV120224-01c]
MIRCKRVYEGVEDEDGQRVLVDRLWPRNIRKEDLHGQWLREVAPSSALRKAFHQGEVDFAGFTQCYRQELAARPEHWYPLLDMAAKGTLTLLYAGKDTGHNNAQVLAEWLEAELDRRGPGSSPVCYAQ